jgi:hypothetical protein
MSESHAKHRAWFDKVTASALSDYNHYDYLERAKVKLRLKYAYEDYARYRWDEDTLLSADWIDDVSPDDFLEWVRFQSHEAWDAKVDEFLSSKEFRARVDLVTAKLEADAYEVFKDNLDARY